MSEEIKETGLPLIFLDIGHKYGAKPGAEGDGLNEQDYNTALRDQIYEIWKARVTLDNLLEMIPWAKSALMKIGAYSPLQYGLITSRENPRLLYGTYEERLEEAAKFPIDAHIQMHFNSFDTDDCTYALVGYDVESRYEDLSLLMANAFAMCLNEELDPKDDQSLITKVTVKGCSRYSGGYEANIVYCLKHAQCPSILMEPLFLSTPAHTAFMKTEEGFMALARAYLKGLDLTAKGLEQVEVSE